MTRLAKLPLFVALCLAAGGIGAALTYGPVRDWYPTLHKPAWTPPDWVFGPVWTSLYLLMAISAWLVWCQAGTRGGRVPLAVFLAQLGLNVCWSGLFFALRSPGLAFAEIVVLWVAILATIFQFRRVSPAAAALLVPYLLWVSFAAALNYSVWVMNP